jgi:hypothetical protein
MSLMKSLPKVARTEVLQRNIPEDWSVKDWTSCKENLHLGRKDDIIKIVQVEGAKCINTWRPNWAGRPKPAGLAHLGVSSAPFSCTRRSFNLSLWRRHHSQGREPFAPRGHLQAREKRREIVQEKDRSTRRKHPQVEKKEDTVGSVTMINGAMSSTLMG